ncbi:MAG: N-acetylmuramoyl-L-alanine amidase [Caulobacteraceae bacterium]|nr:N-acetylmuramoyl-L-alanine amidase [Caulobacteraceae bacterium]
MEAGGWSWAGARGWKRVLGTPLGQAALALAFAAACITAFAGVHRPRADVLAVRLAGDDDETRLVVDLGRAARGRVDASAPGRAIVTLAANGSSRSGPGRGLVRRWSLEAAPGGVRIALQLEPRTQVRRRFLLPPADGVADYRYVVDFGPPPPAAAPARASAAEPVLAAAIPGAHSKKVIVIDAGHGGRDPGAAGTASCEKQITLLAALALEARLKRTGRYEVVLTRASDAFVPLEARVQTARQAGADLFISLHADSDPDPGTHGASVYTLSERGVGRVGHVLTRHDWFYQAAVAGDDHAVGQILVDLSQRSTRNRSDVFAETLTRRAGESAPELPRRHRSANYFVLLAPDVPAVLLEMGFMTNAEDEARLNDRARRDALMDEVAGAIDAYFAKQTRLNRSLRPD